jgi:hypothetical protein
MRSVYLLPRSFHCVDHYVVLCSPWLSTSLKSAHGIKAAHGIGNVHGVPRRRLEQNEYCYHQCVFHLCRRSGDYSYHMCEETK